MTKNGRESCVGEKEELSLSPNLLWVLVLIQRGGRGVKVRREKEREEIGFY